MYTTDKMSSRVHRAQSEAMELSLVISLCQTNTFDTRKQAATFERSQHAEFLDNIDWP